MDCGELRADAHILSCPCGDEAEADVWPGFPRREERIWLWS